MLISFVYGIVWVFIDKYLYMGNILLYRIF